LQDGEALQFFRNVRRSQFRFSEFVISGEYSFATVIGLFGDDAGGRIVRGAIRSLEVRPVDRLIDRGLRGLARGEGGRWARRRERRE